MKTKPSLHILWVALYFPGLAGVMVLAWSLLAHATEPLHLMCLSLEHPLARWCPLPPWPKGLDPDQSLIFYGDLTRPTEPERQKALADRWPQNPVYYANYVNALLTTVRTADLKNETRRLRILDALTHGEQLEPQNAFYNFMKAALLIEAAAEIAEDPTRTYPTLDRDNQPRTNEAYKIQIHVPALFNQGLDEFFKGVKKPFYKNYQHEMLTQCLELLGPVENYADMIRRVRLLESRTVPDIGHIRALVRSTEAYAIHLAEHGNSEGVRHIGLGAEVLAAKVAANTRWPQQVVSLWGYRTLIRGHALLACDILNLDNECLRRKTELLREMQIGNGMLRIRHPQAVDPLRGTGFLLTMTQGMQLPGFHPDATPYRLAEYTVTEEIFLACLIAVLAVFSLGSLLLAIPGSLTTATERRERLFLGIKPLLKICLLGLGAPAVLYLRYASFTLGMRDLPLYLNCERTGTAWIVAAVMAVILLFTLSYQLVRLRARELGVPAPPVPSLRRRLVWIVPGFLLFAVNGYFLATRWESDGCACGKGVEFLTISNVLLTMFILIWVFGGTFRLFWVGRKVTTFRAAYFRTLAAVLLFAALILALAGGTGLKQYETRLLQNAPIPRLNDLELTNYRLIKDHMAGGHNRLMNEYRIRF